MNWKEFDESLTPEEKALASWFDLSDERLGQMIRANCEHLKSVDENKQFKGLLEHSACLMLIARAEKTNAGKLSIDLSVTQKSSNKKSNWQIIVKQTKP